ncbi:uncharacterized [Tachysurus ichikawai]
MAVHGALAVKRAKQLFAVQEEVVRAPGTEPSVWSSAPNLSNSFSPSEATHALLTHSHMLSFCSVLQLCNNG